MTLPDIRHNDLLRGLSRSELERIWPLFERRHFEGGQVILRAGEAGDCLYVIESGFVAVVVAGLGGRESVIATLGPGQIFGEMALLTGQPRSAEVRALVATVTRVLTVSAFYGVAGRAPALLLNLGRVLAERLRQMNAAGGQPERRAVILLLGSVPALTGSLIATNLAAALAIVSGRRTMLLDVPAAQACRLPGREWSPDIVDLHGGDETVAHLSRLQVGPVSLHVANLPPFQELVEESAVVRAGHAIQRCARIADFCVVNLVSGPDGAVERFLPVATHVYLVTPSVEIDRKAQTLAGRLRAEPTPSRTIGVIVLASDSGSAPAVRELVAVRLGLGDCTLLPGQATLLREAARSETPVAIGAPRSEVSRSLCGLARRASGLRVGLALSSGAARGIAHVGVVAALNRVGVPIDVVTGTSIGAVIGAGVALGMDLRQIEETMNRLIDLWPGVLRPALPGAALFSGRGLEPILRGLAGDAQFDELPVPFGAVATDLHTGRSVYLRAGSVVDAVRASISIPLIFPPVVVNGHVLVDGFVTNPVPTQFARLLGADIVIASSLSRRPDETNQSPLELDDLLAEAVEGRSARSNILDTYLRCADIMMAGRGEHDALAADLTVWPRFPQLSWREWQRGGAPMRAGEQAVEEEVGALRSLLPWLRVSL